MIGRIEHGLAHVGMASIDKLMACIMYILIIGWLIGILPDILRLDEVIKLEFVITALVGMFLASAALVCAISRQYWMERVSVMILTILAAVQPIVYILYKASESMEPAWPYAFTTLLFAVYFFGRVLGLTILIRRAQELLESDLL